MHGNRKLQLLFPFQTIIPDTKFGLRNTPTGKTNTAKSPFYIFYQSWLPNIKTDNF